MNMIVQKPSMLELVRKGRPAVSSEVDEKEDDVEDGSPGEFRYFNVPPNVLRRMLGEGVPEGERALVERALSAWEGVAPLMSVGIEAGEPFRGEPREAVKASRLVELVRPGDRAEHVFVMGSMFADGESGGTPSGGLEALAAMVDCRMLEEWMRMEPLPDPEVVGWF
jgi:hypothetical protein